MDSHNILDAIGDINDDAIRDAKTGIAANRPHFGRRLPAAMIAAILALFLMGAGVAAILYGDSIQNWFSHYWEVVTGQPMGQNQTVIIDRLSQEIGVSQTVGDLTVTVDSATMGDDCFYLLLHVKGLELSEKQTYSFEKYMMEIVPDPLENTAGVGSNSFQYFGIDGDGTALFLVKHDYLLENSLTENDIPLSVTLCLTNFVQTANTETEKLLVEGEWCLEFTLDNNQMPAAISLPNTEVQLRNLSSEDDVTVTVTNIELTCTGIHFQYDYQNGELQPIDNISAILKNGVSISYNSGGGYPLSDGTTLNCSYQWQIPIDLDEVSLIQIGSAQISMP